MPTKKSDATDTGRAMPATDQDPAPDPQTSDPDPASETSEAIAPDPMTADPLASRDEHEPPGASADPVEPTDGAAERHPEIAAEATPVVEEAAPAEQGYDDGHDEDRGWSFPARALAFLLVLLGGAAVGVWAAPKLAPRLPAGMAPVAAWLTPGRAEAEAEIAALQARLDGEVAALNDRIAALPDAAALQGEAAGLVSTARTELGGEIDALRAAMAQAAGGDTTERVGRLETAVEGATAELASLKAQIASGAASLSDDAAAGIDTYRAELDGLKAEVGRLSGAVSGLGGRLDEVAASAEARVSEAQAQAAQVEETATAQRDLSAAQADLAQIRAALASGAPFEAPLDSLASNAGVSPPAGLAAAAASGVATPAALRTSFGDAAHEAIRASIAAGAGEGLVARSRAFLEAQVASRSLTPQEGATPDAVLSRVEDALRRDDRRRGADRGRAAAVRGARRDAGLDRDGQGAGRRRGGPCGAVGFDLDPQLTEGARCSGPCSRSSSFSPSPPGSRSARRGSSKLRARC